MEIGCSLPHSQQSTTCPYPSQINPFLFSTHLWQAQLVSFLVGIRTYQHRGSLTASSHVTWCLHFRLMHRVESTCSDVSEGALPTFLSWLKWILNWCSGRKFPSYGGKRRCGAICWNIIRSKISERTSLKEVQLNRRTWLEQRPPWHPDFLLHFTCVSAHAIWWVRYITSVGRESIAVNHYGVERTANLVTKTRLLKVLGFWENQKRWTPCFHFKCGIMKTLTTVFRKHTMIEGMFDCC